MHRPSGTRRRLSGNFEPSHAGDHAEGQQRPVAHRLQGLAFDLVQHIQVLDSLSDPPREHLFEFSDEAGGNLPETGRVGVQFVGPVGFLKRALRID